MNHIDFKEGNTFELKEILLVLKTAGLIKYHKTKNNLGKLEYLLTCEDDFSLVIDNQKKDKENE